MDLGKFRAMVENGTGYQGSPAVDHYPYMGLIECMHSLSTECYSQQVSLFEAAHSAHNAEVEAVSSYLTEGVSIDYESLNEAAKEGLLTKIKNFFMKIKKLIDSIIAKIKINIDRKFLTGKQFYERYKNNPGLRDAANKGLKFKGYKMEKDEPFAKAGDASVTPSDVITLESPKEMLGKSAEDMKGKVDALSSDSAADRQSKIANTLTGENVSGDSWKSDLQEVAFGDKEEFEYGEGMFDITTVSKVLQSDAGFKAVTKAYDNLKKAVDKDEREMTDFVNKKAQKGGMQEYYNNQHADADEAGKVAKIDGEKEVREYCTKYLSLYQEAIGVINDVRAIRVSYHNTRMDQAKKMFQMMITGKVKKEETESIEIDSDLDFDF